MGLGGDSHDSSHQFISTIKEVTYIFPRGLNASLLMPVIHPTPQPANTTSAHTRAQRERQVEKVSEGWYYWSGTIVSSRHPVKPPSPASRTNPLLVGTIVFAHGTLRKKVHAFNVTLFAFLRVKRSQYNEPRNIMNSLEMLGVTKRQQCFLLSLGDWFIVKAVE